MPAKETGKSKPRRSSPLRRTNKMLQPNTAHNESPEDVPEALYRRIVKAAREGIWVTDTSGMIIYANQVVARMLGYDDPSDIIGRSPLDLVAEQSRTAARGRFKRHRAGQSERYELVMLRRNGSRFWVMISAGPLPDEQGRVTEVLWLITDIDERKQAERHLRNNERRLESLLEAVPGAIVAIDPAGRIEMVNARLEEIFGYNRQELTGQPVEILLPERFQSVHVRQRDAYTAHPVQKPMGTGRELIARRRDGSEFPVEIGLSYVSDGQGDLVIADIVDISARKEAEQARERAIRAYRTLSTGNQAVLHAAVEKMLLHDVCRAIHEVGGYNMAWVGYKINDKARTVRPMAWSGIGGDELPGAKLTWARTEQGRGPSGTVIRTGKPVVMQKLATDPNFITYRARALELGHGSVAVFPLADKGEVLGVLGVYAAEPEAFDDTELALLTEMAGDLAYGIQALRTRDAHRQAEAARRESEASFKLLFFANPHPMWVYDVDSLQFLEVNEAAVRRYGYSHEEFLGMKITQIRPEEDIPSLHESVQSDIDNPHASSEWRHRLKNGELIDVEIVSHILPFAGHRARLVVAHDITVRKRAERELAQVNRAYRTLSAANQALVRATNEQALLDEVCTAICHAGGYKLAWVGYKADDPARSIIPMAWAGIGRDELLSGTLTWADTEDGQRPAGMAIRTGLPVAMQNIATDPNFILYRTRALELGFGSGVALPLLMSGHPMGMLSVYATESDAFDDREVALLTEMAGDLAYGIQALRTRLLQKQAERTLDQQNQRLLKLYAVGQVVNSTLDVGEILDFVVDEAMHVTGAERGLALVVDPAARIFVRRSLRGFTSKETARAEEIPLKLDQGLNGQAYQTGHVVRIDDVREQPDYYPLIASTRSELVVPILREDEVLGNMDLQSPEVGAFREVDTDYLNALAEQAALAITNARLYHELESYSEILEQAVGERTTELQATKDRVETILSSIGDALLVLRLDGRIEQVNPAFERQTGYNSVEAELKDHHDLLQLEFGSKGDYQAALETLTPGQVWQGETMVRRKDGSTYDAAMTIAPVRDAQGTIRLLVAIIRDITPLKEVERAKDQFVSNVSHELRTPITSLRLNYDLLRRKPVEQDKYIERMKRETERLNDLIEDLLRLSRLDQGSVQLALNPLDLNMLAAQYVNDRIPLAESRELSLIFAGEPGLAPVMADEGLLGQALSVLLTNALNYTPAGGRVTIGTHHRDTDGQTWAGFSVSDTGPGIPPEELSQLFTRFFRGSVGRKSGAPGTGLGLAIAREIVERHGGQIEVGSKEPPGTGAMFDVWLPVVTSRLSGQKRPQGR